MTAACVQHRPSRAPGLTSAANRPCTDDCTWQVTCERCGRTTTDRDLWDPEAGTGRIFCDRCWPVRDEPVDVEIVHDAFLGWVAVRMADGHVVADAVGEAELHEHVREHRPDLRIYTEPAG